MKTGPIKWGGSAFKRGIMCKVLLNQAVKHLLLGESRHKKHVSLEMVYG